jgi:SpoVK/Ycf46/Vps4 family AAA+-type ATPase
MVMFTISNPKSAYGVLKKGRINGALLYGPPGTGKTHLARVLARESNAVMIHASGAELVSKWVGETEKLIKGLFNLGRMVSPSIIFIDEADALFRARGSDDRDHERSRMSQLLNETDGLKRAANPPFVLLATNFPHQLDNAVLRRVPGRLYIGLPSAPARKRIFSICLTEECWVRT